MELAERFRDLRTKAGLSKTALARPRYTVSYVSQIEAGKRTPSAEAMEFFASRLGVSPRFLASGVPDGLEDSLRYRLEEARVATRANRLDEADDGLRSVVAEADRYGLRRIHAMALAQLGDELALAGRLREAIDRIEEALDSGNLMERDAGMAVSRLARTYRAVGDIAYAGELVESYLVRGDRPPLEPGIVAELESVGWDIDGEEELPQLCRPVGCGVCGRTGYHGRFAIQEVLLVSEEVERMIVERAHTEDIKKVALAQGMTTLRQAGLVRAREGTTSIEEILRVVA